MKFIDQRAIEEIKTFDELNDGDFFQFNGLFYVKTESGFAFNIEDCQLEEFSVNETVQQRIAEIIFH